jgi:Kef-type K+ transport system membrane component KefB
MKRLPLLYLAILTGFGLLIYAAIQQGRKLDRAPAAAPTNARDLINTSTGHEPGTLIPTTGEASGLGPSASLFVNLRENLQDPLSRLLVRLILIVLVARLCGFVARYVGQPAVIGEMLAGILLGPSLLGWVWPDCFHFVFPPSSLGTLRLLSQIGVCLFMFVIGMDLDLDHLRHQARTAVFVSQVSILFPYFLGVVASLLLFKSLASPNTTFVAFALFIGISMSITAFPVLARILEERGLTKTPLGSTALACAATDDVTAWTILAFVVAIVKAGHFTSALVTIGLVVLFVGIMCFWIKPRLPHWFAEATLEAHSAGKGAMATVLVFLFASALFTDLIGVHALFGAFLAGVVMPAHGAFRESLKIRLEHFSSVFLLPLFFAFTGLRTQIGLLNDTDGWAICAALIAIATIGKLGAAMLTARLTGVNWIDSFALGALMNTRGLVELIALNIGYDLGILPARIFVMLVIMALVTTGLTGPLLSVADYLRARRPVAVRPA